MNEEFKEGYQEVKDQYFIFVDEVMSILKVSKGKAYELMRSMNGELKKKGYYTVAGRVPRKYFMERCGVVR